MSIPRTIHFSVPRTLDADQRAAVEKTRSLHPDWEIRIWHDEPVEGGLLGHYFSRVRSGAQLADLCRLDALHVHGGFYLDSDIDLSRPLDDLANFEAFLVASEDGAHLTNAFFAAPAGHGATRALIDRLVAHEPDWSRPPNETTGPHLFTSVLRSRTDVEMLPRESFYPYGYSEARPLRTPPTAFGVHEWSASWLSAEEKLQMRRDARPGLPARLGKSLRGKAGPLLAKAARAIMPEEALFVARSYRAEGDLAVRTVFGLDMLVPAGDTRATPRLAFSGTVSAVEERFTASVLRGGDWAVDVGAGLGVQTVLAASRCGRFGRVFAIEPDPEARRHVNASVAMNGFGGRVRVEGFAASDATRPVGAGRSGAAVTDAGAAEVERAPQVEAGSRRGRVEVPAMRLDGFFRTDLPIKLMRIGVHARLSAILSGADRLLASRAVEHLAFTMGSDVDGPAFDDLVAVILRITGYGYTAHVIDREGGLTAVHPARVRGPLTDDLTLVLKAVW